MEEAAQYLLETLVGRYESQPFMVEVTLEVNASTKVLSLRNFGLAVSPLVSGGELGLLVTADVTAGDDPIINWAVGIMAAPAPVAEPGFLSSRSA